MQMTHLFYLKPRADNVVNHLNGTNKNKQRRRRRCPRNNVKPRCYLLRAVFWGEGGGERGEQCVYTALCYVRVINLLRPKRIRQVERTIL